MEGTFGCRRGKEQAQAALKQQDWKPSGQVSCLVLRFKQKKAEKERQMAEREKAAKRTGKVKVWLGRWGEVRQSR